MWLGPQQGTTFFWIALSLTASVAKSQQCPEGTYWCQDRCGTDLDTCCQTPDGQHNLCGPGTICCGFGCCPNNSYTCNVDYSCTGPDDVSIPPAPNPNPSTTEPSQPGSTTAVHTPPPPPATTLTGSGGQTVVYSSGVLIVGTSTMTLPPATTPTVIETVGVTLTVTPPSAPEPSPPPDFVIIIGTNTATLPAVTSPSTLVTLGHTFTLTPPANTNPGQAPSTIVIVGTQTATIPLFSETTTLVTLSKTFTLEPPPPPPTTSENPGSPVESPVVIIDETKSVTLPPVTQETTLTTGGQTITLYPGGPPTITLGNPPPPPPTTTSENPGSPPESPVVIIDETKSVTLPPVTQETTLTTEGQTITLHPGGPPTITLGNPPPPPPTTTPKGTATKPVVVIIGTGSLTFPQVNRETTVTTEGQTFTLFPGGPPTVTVGPPKEPPTTTAETTSDSGGGGPVLTFTEWPPEAVITPVDKEVKKPEPEDDDGDGDDDSAVIPCKLWFFSICIKFKDINIRGWKIKLPPGIYPPGPPPLRNIKFPTPIGIKGELPPWPKFTVGPDHVPTFPSEPEPTECETKTASLCSTTTSYVVSTIDGKLETISSVVPPPTCAEIRGCLVTDSTAEATATKTEGCGTSTVTDVVITCSGTGTADCATKTEIPKTGCSVTPTTTTVSCKPAPTGNAPRQEGEEYCPVSNEHIVYPRDGTKSDETGAIYAAMKELLQDEKKIIVSDTKTLGINFWRVFLEPGQVQKIKEIPNVGAVYRPCTSDCGDPQTADTNWRYQLDYIEEFTDGVEGRTQMVFLSKNQQGRDRFDKNYWFDVSMGQDIPVYIVDTGAQMDHQEFTDGDNIASKTEFMFVGQDYDGQNHRDDSGVPLGGICESLYCNPHGTGMLGMVAGANLGLAKKAKTWMVRVPRRQKKGGGNTPEDFLQGVSMVNDVFSDDSGVTRAILSLSWTYWLELYQKGSGEDSEEAFKLWQRRLYDLLTSLIRKGVFVVTGSGNQAVVNSWPALFGAERSKVEPENQEGWLHIPELLVVGAVDPRTGDIWWKSGVDVAKELPHIYAPGANTLGTQGNKGKWLKGTLLNPTEGTYKLEQGTSVSTAYTAGLAAYFLKLHQLGRLRSDGNGNAPDMSPGGLRKYILDAGWSRHTHPEYGDILGIWNRADTPTLEQDGYCRYKPGEVANRLRKLRRQEDNAPLTGQCVPGTSPTGSPTTTGPTGTGTETGTVTPTGFVCTPETVDQCAPAVICGAPRRPGCRDGKCICLLPPTPTGFVCTPETVDQCAPEVICGAPRRPGCRDGRCICLLPDPPTQTPDPTTLSTTSKPPKPTEKPKVKLELGVRQCNSVDIFEGGGDINSWWVTDYAQYTCTGTALEEAIMYPGKKPITFHTETNGAPYFMSISWKPGCKTTVDRVSPAFPLWQAGEGAVNRDAECITLLYNNWKKCTGNKGRGGYIDAGCLRYEFSAKKI
ncbi:hypothetical protein AJ80_04162 [Polytolypa hystricis UAMH7299]|uniref:Peptidase S8/S53 domain-containing protein n=1 Tax=Polytolypa hystricis (strain UAMH7299) TaxID=1447883 RepID=A0A2B7YDQ9_POLH7|nr:hypothetical protein AJ80_04162 [Polytolypa hystricis UAMH7299]